MTNIKQFIAENDVDKAYAVVDPKVLESAESLLGIKFGKELFEYLKTFGYLAYEYVELYGINANQGLESDMVKQTLYLHKYFPVTTGFVAIENQGDGDYYLVNERDEIFEYDTNLEELIPTNLLLFEYIVQRFETAKDQIL